MKTKKKFVKQTKILSGYVLFSIEKCSQISLLNFVITPTFGNSLFTT